MGRAACEQVEALVSKHARHRSAQSNLRDADIDLVCRYGILMHRTGVRFYVVRRREVERYRGREPRLEKLHDVVLIVSNDDNTVITMYRSRKAHKDIKRKSKVHF